MHILAFCIFGVFCIKSVLLTPCRVTSYKHVIAHFQWWKPGWYGETFHISPSNISHNYRLQQNKAQQNHMNVSQKFRFKAPDNQNCVVQQPTGSTLGRLRYSTAPDRFPRAIGNLQHRISATGWLLFIRCVSFTFIRLLATWTPTEIFGAFLANNFFRL